MAKTYFKNIKENFQPNNQNFFNKIKIIKINIKKIKI